MFGIEKRVVALILTKNFYSLKKECMKEKQI